VLYSRNATGSFSLRFVSDAIEAMLGYSAVDLVHTPGMWMANICPDDLERVLERQAAFSESDSGCDEYRVRNSAGDYVWLRDQWQRVSGEAGASIEVVGSWTLIDHRQRSLASLLTSYIEHTSGVSLDAVLRTSLIFIREQLNVHYADVLVRHLEPGLVNRYWLNEADELQGEELQLTGQQAERLGWLMKQSEPCHRPHINQADEPLWDDDEFIARGLLNSMLVPLCMDDSCVGILRFFSSQTEKFNALLEAFLPLLAPSMTQFIHNATLYDRLLDEQGKLKQAVEERERALYELNRFRHALDSPDDVVFLIDPELMRFVDFNRSAIDTLEYSSEELLQMGPHDITPDYDVTELQEIYHQVIAKGIDLYDITTVLQGKSGKQIPVEIRFSPFDDQVNKTTIIAMVRDISDRMAVAEALRQSEEHWRSLAANSPDHIFLLDLDLKFKFLNYAGQGIKMEDIIGQSVMLFVPPDFNEAAQRCFDVVKSTGKPSSYYSSLTANGETRYYESHVGPVLRDGKVTALVVNARDITERKQVENKLRQSAVAVENAGEGVVVTDIQKRIVSVNHAFTETTLYPEEEALGQSYDIFKTDRHDESFYQQMWQEVRAVGRWQGETWCRRKTGEVFPAWATISTVRDDDGDLTNYVLVFSDISVIKSSQDKLDFLAHHDALTGLPNRLLFSDRLEHAIQRANRQRDKVAVFFIDLDRFKNINDTLGHPVGDELIQQAANRLRRAVREEDTVARLGGDEFIIALEGINNDHDVDGLARKVINTFQEPFEIQGHELHVTLSMGVSLYPADGQDGESLIKNADVAMYRAKEEGRNNYNFYTSDLATSVFERLALESALRRALERNEMRLVYQPQFCLEGDRVIGCESLMRWDNPAFGEVSPSRFVPIAEESGLIIELGRWGLITACSQMERWLLAGAPIERMAVNVSAIQLQRSDFVATVKEVLEETGLSAKYLELEVTESVIMHNSEHATEILSELKALGVGLAIDDFGTGYSSLSYLKRLPVDKLKIDRSFVSDIPHDSNDVEIARAVIALAKSLGLRVIAEGLETEEQRRFMITEGGQHAQGYLFGKPMSSEEFFNLYLRKHCHLN